MEIVVATRNRHKLRELVALLKVRGIRWRSLQAFSRVPSVAERAHSFEANAIAKARAVARATGHLALADDSGLEVQALNGAPGVRSARFAGTHCDDEANNHKLLQLLARVPLSRRHARYRCSLALVSPRGVVALTHGTWHGRIATHPKGRGGFGYDPIFCVPSLGKTVGELPLRMKQRLSHRARAATPMRRVLQQLATAHRVKQVVE